jgi:hypothetical protein
MSTYPQFKLLLALRNYVDNQRSNYTIDSQADRERDSADIVLLKNIDTKLRALAKQALRDCDVSVPDNASLHSAPRY